MRHKKVSKRKISPDPKYQSEQIAKFINYIMRRGKKTVAQKIVYGALNLIEEKTKKNPQETFDQAIINITPSVEVKSRRIGGGNFQVPIPVGKERGFALSSRWLIDAAQGRKGKPMMEKLANEILSALKGEGAAIKKKEDVHRMAEANKAFAHFARFGRRKSAIL